jgi:acyl carrier protein
VTNIIDESTILNSICLALVKVLNLTPEIQLRPETRLRNALVVNSLDFLKIFTILENEFDADLMDDSAGESVIETVKTLVDFIASKVNKD